MRKIRFSRKSDVLSYILYLLSTTILGVPVLCGVMEILKDFLSWIM